MPPPFWTLAKVVDERTDLKPAAADWQLRDAELPGLEWTSVGRLRYPRNLVSKLAKVLFARCIVFNAIDPTGRDLQSTEYASASWDLLIPESAYG